MPGPQAFNAQVDGEGNFIVVGASKQADLDATSSGNTQLVAAVSGKKIRVVGVVITNKGSSLITTKFQSSTTDITASHGHAANGGGYARTASMGSFLFETVAGEALNFNLSAGGAVGCDVAYHEV